MARGVIARTIEALQDDDTVDRIDVVYVCSNADIARQNITRIDPTGQRQLRFASRLTLLAKAAPNLRAASSSPGGTGPDAGKPVNLVSFTPGTSFDMGWHTGAAEERALLYLLLRHELDLTGGWRRRGALNILRWTVKRVEVFQQYVDRLDDELRSGIDPTIAAEFMGAARSNGLVEEFNDLVTELGRRQTLSQDESPRARLLIKRLRTTLARAGVETLEPDLIILDEFQRFRNLLDPNSEAGELAHHLFNYPQARVLLLSATPYKPFTYAEERESDDHHADFMRTLRFLAAGVPDVDVARIETDLARYRSRVVDGLPVHDLVSDLRSQLLTVMCRQERPDPATIGAFVEHADDAAAITEDDLLTYVGLRALARRLDAPMSVDYWKSGPYFLNFSDGYQFGTRLKNALLDPQDGPELEPLLADVPTIDADTVRGFGPLDMGNARLRQLAGETVAAGWWKFLWMPPSLPYLQPGGPYAEAPAHGITKRLVFSSWAATPTAVASLLSYEAARRVAEGSALHANTAAARASLARRFTYSLDGDRPQAMTTLALFWPSPRLAELADPLTAARRAGGAADPYAALAAIAEQIRSDLPQGAVSTASSAAAWHWQAAVSGPGSVPAALQADPDRIVNAMAGVPTGTRVPNGEPVDTHDDADGEPDRADGQGGLRAHVEAALAAIGSLEPEAIPPDLAETIATLALHSPGNCAWRALNRLTHDQPTVSRAGHWEAAAVLANGLRRVFARWESTLLLDHLIEAGVPYWRAVLTYCGWGNLQSVLDEYLHHLYVSEGSPVLDDHRLRSLAEAAADAIAVRVSRYEAFDPHHPADPIAFTSRFALRYGGRRLSQDDVRQPEVRNAFNSPFWPFVLASTSVGQEGIDLHWWCHAIVHWNTPANPVDFEQREGRVNRRDGHAVRRNIAERHAANIFSDPDPNPWRAAYRVATDEQDRCGDFAPHWVYPGSTRIERHVAPYPLSSDRARYEQLKDDVALYRLTFGQPRQEDMLELLRRTAPSQNDVIQARIDLSPPRRSN
ncbi:MAG: helicase [Kineosporiaceae bacterium]|nr:helicase [Kineosporiaceae bacterium]